MRIAKTVLLTGAMLVGLTASAVAAPITPVYDAFGTFPATFGGSGIPNHAVATSTYEVAPDTFITIGLTAHQRLVGPNLANDGAGTFTAPAGEGDPGLAKWNFAYYFAVTGPAVTSSYSAQLLYDFDPGAGTDESLHGVINIATFPLLLQDSQNLGFGFLATPIPTVIAPPAYPSFNPKVNGEYTFAIRLFNGSTQVDETAIRVNATPEPGTMVLFGLGALGMAAAGRRRKNKAETL